MTDTNSKEGEAVPPLPFLVNAALWIVALSLSFSFSATLAIAPETRAIWIAMVMIVLLPVLAALAFTVGLPEKEEDYIPLFLAGCVVVWLILAKIIHGFLVRGVRRWRLIPE